MKSALKIKLHCICRLLFIPLFFILSASSIQAASIVGQWGTGEYVDVHISGSIAACAAYGSGVDFFDISNPATPTLLANFDTSYSCRKVFLNGTRAYAADGNAGLHIIDISNPASPTLLGTYASGAAQDVYVVGSMAYIANAREGLLIIDVSNPEAPTLSGSFATKGSAVEIYVSGTTAYIIEQRTGLEIVDVSNPAAPVLLSTRLNKRARGVSVTGNIACFSIGGDGFELLDISNPASPQMLASEDFADSRSTENAVITGDRLYVVSTGAGLQIFDITDPTAPTLSGTHLTPGTAIELFVAGSTAFVACDGGGLSIINIADPEAPTEIGKCDHSGEAFSVWVDGTVAYLAKGEGNLQIIDISNPQFPTRLGHFDHHSTCVQTVGNLAYTAGNNPYLKGEHKFIIADISNPAKPVESGSCNLPGNYSEALQIVGNRAYVANDSNGLMIIDISDPINPSIIGSYSAGFRNPVKGLHIIGDTAYLCCHSDGLHIVNVSNPQAPALIGSCDTPAYAKDVDITGTRAYVADEWGGVQIIDITDPEHPSISNAVDLPGWSNHIQIIGDLVYVTLNENGTGSLRIINISDPANPELTETIDAAGAPQWVHIVDNKAFVAEGKSGRLLIINLGAENTRNIYFPHAACADGWSTEIALINTGTIEAKGDLFAYNNLGEQVGRTKSITLQSRGRSYVRVDSSFAYSDSIAYLIFKTGSQSSLVGYTKFYHYNTGYRVALPTTPINNPTFNISHIASDDNWWTGIALLNTTTTPKTLAITFSDGQSKNIALAANEHKSVSIRNLFAEVAQPQIDAAVITGCIGVVGFELFGSIGDGRQLSGISLSGKTESTIYFPHISSADGWWTGLVAYDPAGTNRTLTITPYAQNGTELSQIEVAIPVGSKKYLNSAAAMGLPENTAWIKIDAASEITGFELFGNNEKKWLAGYTGVELKSRRGIFATLEQDNGWTGLALVNTESEAATVTLRARNNRGQLKARKDLTLAPHERLIGLVTTIFAREDISEAHYISYESNRELVGFQINGNGRLLDALPALKY